MLTLMTKSNKSIFYISVYTAVVPVQDWPSNFTITTEEIRQTEPPLHCVNTQQMGNGINVLLSVIWMQFVVLKQRLGGPSRSLLPTMLSSSLAHDQDAIASAG